MEGKVVHPGRQIGHFSARVDRVGDCA